MRRSGGENGDGSVFTRQGQYETFSVIHNFTCSTCITLKGFIWPIIYLNLSGQRAAREARKSGDHLDRDNCAGIHIRLLSHSVQEVLQDLIFSGGFRGP